MIREAIAINKHSNFDGEDSGALPLQHMMIHIICRLLFK